MIKQQIASGRREVRCEIGLPRITKCILEKSHYGYACDIFLFLVAIIVEVTAQSFSQTLNSNAMLKDDD